MSHDVPSVQRRRPLHANGETGYVLEPSERVTVLTCGHSTSDGYASPGPATKRSGRWYFCMSHRRWMEAA